VTPFLPPAIIADVPGRGELFARVSQGHAVAAPVLLLHGWQATADLNFCTLYPMLAGRTFVAPDAREHGRGPLSDKPFRLEDCAEDAVALLDHLGIERALLLGYSMGGATAQLLADRHPERVAGLVVAASALRFGDGIGKRIAIRAGGWQGALQRLSGGRWLAHRLVDRAARTHPEVEDWRDWLVAELERGHPAGMRSAGRALARFDGRPLATRSVERAIPTAFILTTGDRLCLPKMQRDAAAALHARTFEVPSDHDAPLAMTKPFTEAVLQALDHVA
jgi:3-oxoadipate enol-lactonase